MNIGIDLGGSHIGIGVVDEAGNILKQEGIDLNEQNAKSIQEFIQDYLLQTIGSLLNDYKVEFIGVASPGTPQDGKITNLVNLGIKELDITNILYYHFHLPVKVKNDAKCAGLAEKKIGSLKQYQDAVFLCLGTGIGASVYIREKELTPMRNSRFWNRTYDYSKRW